MVRQPFIVNAVGSQGRDSILYKTTDTCLMEG